MRVLILDRDYDSFLNELYAREDRPRGSYDKQWRALMATRFGTADFYSRNLVAQGHAATEIVVNCLPLQKQWAAERGGVPLALRMLPDRGSFPRGTARWREEIVLRQARDFRADVIHLQDPIYVSDRLIHQLRKTSRMVTAQIASAYPSLDPLRRFDLMLSSLPNFVDAFRTGGIRAEHFGLGFESTLLDELERDERHDLVFVGGVSTTHSDRVALLEQVARTLPLAWWGYGVELLPSQSALRASHRGAAWGLDAYRALASGRICLNQHADFAGDYANNMRLYEATGVGTMLLTDAKRNIGELFEPGRELVTYSSVNELIERAGYYLEHDNERRAIAAAGQRRTLADHTYARRMQRFVEIVSRYIS